MALKAIICGAIMIAIGVYGYTNATPDDTGKVSPTALIPAGLGGGLVLLGLIAFNPGVKKHAMHLAAMVGVIGFLGGFMPLIRQQVKGKEFDPTAPAALSGILMALISAVFVFLCIQSFIQARKAREAVHGTK